MPTNHDRRRGVTMLELIIVIGLLLFLAALLLPAVAKVRQAAGRTQSTNNLKMLGISMHNFASASQVLPPIAGRANNQEGSLLFHLLPYLEQDGIYRKAQGNGWNVANEEIPMFLDPEDKLSDRLFLSAIGTTNYAGSWLAFKEGANRFPAAFPDGTSNTMAFATRLRVCNGTPTAWAYAAISSWTPMFGYYSYAKFQVNPQPEECDPTVPQAISTSGILVALCDGSVRSLQPEISSLTWYRLTDPADGQVIDNDF